MPRNEIAANELTAIKNSVMMNGLRLAPKTATPFVIASRYSIPSAVPNLPVVIT